MVLILGSVSIMIASAAGMPTSGHVNSPEIASSSGSTSQHVSIYSTFSGKNEELYVPVNSSGILVYPDWHIWLYGSGSFTFSSNGTTIETGVSLGTFDFSYTFPGPSGSTANASLVFQGVTYTFSDTIIGPLSHHVIESVSVSSSYPGQDQFLTVASGISGGLMYPHWVATLQSSENESYSILVNGQQIASGTVVGTKTVDFNVTGNVTSVSIGLGTHVYKYPDEIISTIPIQKYYGPKPPTLQYTFAEYEYGIIKAFIASLFAVVIASFSVRKWIVEHEKREVRLI